MALDGEIDALAARIADEFNAVRTEVETELLFRGLREYANTAALDADELDSSYGTIVGGISDVGTYTGIAGFNGLFMGVVPVLHLSSSDFPINSLTQQIYITDTTGGLRTLRRFRTWNFPDAVPAWGSWTEATTTGLDAEAVRDLMAATLVQGANVTITPDDGADTITIAASGGGGGGDQVGEVKVNSWLAPFNEMANSSSLTGVIGTEYAVQIVLAEEQTFDQIATRLWSGSNASLVARVGVYADVGGVPSVNVGTDLGTIPLTANGLSSATIGSPVVLAAGVWWLTIVQQVGTAAIFTKAAQPKWPNPVGASDLTSGCAYYSRTGSTGALSGNTGAWSLVTGTWNQNFAPVAIRRSA